MMSWCNTAHSLLVIRTLLCRHIIPFISIISAVNLPAIFENPTRTHLLASLCKCFAETVGLHMCHSHPFVVHQEHVFSLGSVRGRLGNHFFGFSLNLIGWHRGRRHGRA